MPPIPMFRGSTKYEPTIATPHPPVDHAVPMAAFALAVGIDRVCWSEVGFPFAAGIMVIQTLVSAWVVQRIRKRIANDPRTDLFMLVELWALLLVALTSTTVAYDLANGVSGSTWAKHLGMSAIGGGLFLLMPAALVAIMLGSRASEGGPIPPGSRARRAIALGPWRSVASNLFLMNVFAVVPAMGYTKNPIASAGSVVALACLLLVIYVLVAQQYWLRSSPPPEVPADRGGAYRQAPPRPVEDPLPADLRATLTRRELKRGIVALLFAVFPVWLHGWLLFE